MVCPGVIILGASLMDHDQNLLVQAEMVNLIEGIPASLMDEHPIQFMLHLDQVRLKASQHHLDAVHDLACACESELQKTVETGGGVTVARAYLAAMKEALDCGVVDPKMTEAMMANVALRLGGQP